MHSYRLHPPTPLTEFWPEGFDPALMKYLERKPLDPLIRECEGCSVRGVCQPLAFARAECREAQTTQRHYKTRITTRPTEELILMVISSGQAYTLDELMLETGLGYSALFKHCNRLAKEGRLRKQKVTRYKTRIVLYSLIESAAT